MVSKIGVGVLQMTQHYGATCRQLSDEACPVANGRPHLANNDTAARSVPADSSQQTVEQNKSDLQTKA